MVERLFISQDILVPTAVAAIPATIVTPKGQAGERFPLAAYAHGFGGSRDENGAIPLLAEALAQKGIASIRLDFAGCGESRESAERSALSDMVHDLLACVDHATAHCPVDPLRLGLIGNSMGGRVVLEALKVPGRSFRSVALLAPAAETGIAVGLFGGSAAYEAALALAEQNGHYDYTSIFGAEMRLSPKWFLEMRDLVLYDERARFDGAMRVIVAEDDDVLLPAIGKHCAAHYGADIVTISGGGHTFGFYTGQDAIRDRAIAAVTEHMASYL